MRFGYVPWRMTIVAGASSRAQAWPCGPGSLLLVYPGETSPRDQKFSPIKSFMACIHLAFCARASESSPRR
jgi:hypothetical protein